MAWELLMLKGDYPERLEATWQYTIFRLSMARQLLMLKMTIHGAWRPPYNILNFIYYWLGTCWFEKMSFGWAWKLPYNIPNFIYHWLGNCWWWRFPFACSHTHIYRFMHILTVMSNNLVNQSTKAISTNELRWIGPGFGCCELRSNGPIFTDASRYAWACVFRTSLYTVPSGMVKKNTISTPYYMYSEWFV